MSKIKSLLLGSAAAVVAATGAQAADLPIIAAEPVDYVRVCDVYGRGFFYIPGTETCLKIDGYVRVEAVVHDNSIAAGRWTGEPFLVTDEETNANTTSFRARGQVRFDARTETEWGLLRSYIAFEGTATDTDPGATVVEKAFIQFAGFTAGLAPSILNFDDVGEYGDQIGNWNDDMIQFAYTAEFGAGFSATIGVEGMDDINSGDQLEDGGSRPLFIIADNAGLDVIGRGDGSFLYDIEGDEDVRDELPALLANIRVDQAWGSAMIGGVIKDNNARFIGDGALSGIEDNEDDLGYAIVGGVAINLPMIAEDDQFILRGAYGRGANTYITGTEDDYPEVGIYANLGGGGSFLEELDLESNEAWSIYGGFSHFFTERLRTNVAVSYAQIDYDDIGASILGDTIFSQPGDLEALTASANLIYSPVAGLDVGLELLYSAFEVERSDEDLFGTVLLEDEDDDEADGFGAIMRVQRSF